jgi:hypothetical protein
MEKTLNRERTYVGRAAYTQRVKDILLECRESLVAEVIAKDLKNFEKGKLHDEMKWLDVAVHACKLLNATGKYIFTTPNELRLASGLIEHAEADGNTVVTIPENVREKLRGHTDLLGSPIRDLDQYVKAWNQSFQFTFVEPEDLTKAERSIFNRTEDIFEVAGGRPTCEGSFDIRHDASRRADWDFKKDFIAFSADDFQETLNLIDRKWKYSIYVIVLFFVQTMFSRRFAVRCKIVRGIRIQVQNLYERRI